MQTLIQVISSGTESLRDKIVNDGKLEDFHLAVSEQKRQTRSPGWSKIHSTNDHKGAINIEWDAASKMLSCRVITRNGGQPNAIIGDFMAYLLASKFKRKIQAIQVIPR